MEDLKGNSLKLYSYLICRAELRNPCNQYGTDNVRIFRQDDINLSQIKRIFKMDERTIKKCWQKLEDNHIIRFTPKDWCEDYELSFNERWKQRRRHPNTYYEIPISSAHLYRTIPQDTLQQLNEVYNVNELTLTLYIVMINFQEQSITNERNYYRFTYKDLCYLYGYQLETATNKKFEAALLTLQSLGLIEIQRTHYTNSWGARINCFVLKHVNFFIDYDINNYSTSEEFCIDKEDREYMKKILHEQYPLSFK